MKYLIMDYEGIPTPVIVPDHVHHDRIAVAQSNGTLAPVESAGLCDLDGSFVSCYGESTSLQVPSRGRKDEKLIEMYIRMRRAGV